MVRKAQADLELNLAKDTKGNTKGFCKQMRSRRKTREDTDLRQNERRSWRWMHLMLFCFSIYQKKLALGSPRSLRLEGKSAARKSYPQLREHLKHIKACILLAEDNSILLCTGKSVKQANGVDPSPLLSTAVATSVVLCPALGYPVQGRHWLIEASTESQSWLRDQSIRYIMRGSCTSHRLFGWNFNYFFIIFYHYGYSN